MSQALLEKFTREREGLVSFVDTTLAQVEGRDLTDAEQRTIEETRERITQIDAQIRPLADFMQARASATDVYGLLDRAQNRARGNAAAPQAETRTLGQIFTQSEQFRAYGGRGTSAIVKVAEYRAVGPDPLLTTTEPGLTLLPQPQRIARDPHLVRHPLLDLVGRVQVSGNSVAFVTTSEAAGADVVPEGAPKPAVVWTATETPYTLETIAGWFKYSRQALQDIEQLASLIDTKIRRAIDNKLNSLATTALVTGVGAGSTITGAAGESLAVVSRRALAELEEFGVASTAILVNPADHAAFDIEMLGKPLGAAQINGGMWNVPIVGVSGVAAGTAYIGDIAESLVYFERAGLEMYTTDTDVSDGAAGAVTSDFRHNILTTLGEVRGKFALVDQSVIRKIVITPAP